MFGKKIIDDDMLTVVVVVVVVPAAAASKSAALTGMDATAIVRISSPGFSWVHLTVAGVEILCHFLLFLKIC